MILKQTANDILPDHNTNYTDLLYKSLHPSVQFQGLIRNVATKTEILT